MRKNKDELDLVEKLEKEIRELKSLNRSLIRQLKKLSKGSNRADELEAILKEELLEKEERTKTKPEARRTDCPDCGSKEVQEADFGVRRLPICQNCGWRGKAKKNV